MTPLTQDYESLLASITLTSGKHESREAGVCAMEMVAYIAGEPHSDHPKCASKVITNFLVTWNDSLPTDEDRNRLIKPILPLVVGTAGSSKDEQRRSYMALDWLLRECAPTFLALTPSLVEHAEALRSHPEVTTLALAKSIGPKADAAWDAAWAAAWAAARAAARDAARDAAWAAARAAAWAAARDAAWDSAWAAARAAAWDAARAAARDAARDAAWAAARAAAWAAARAAARERLKPAGESLQASAVLLVRKMCEVGR